MRFLRRNQGESLAKFLMVLVPGGLSLASGTPIDLKTTWPEAALEARLDSTLGTSQIAIGSELRLLLKSKKDANLVLILVNDDTRRAKLYIPNSEAYGDRLVPPEEARIPGSAAEPKLVTDVAGASRVWVIASSDQLLSAGPGAADWQSEDDIAARLERAMAEHPDIKIAVRVLGFTVKDNEAAPQIISAANFVHSFDETRDVHCYQRDFPIQFDSNSASLTAWGRRQLDQIGSGMKSQELIKDRFQIEGHTDDVGSDEYNLVLSEKRAAAVAKYLVDSGVSQLRLEASGVGKKNPAVSGMSAEARAANRRVAIRRVDGEC